MPSLAETQREFAAAILAADRPLPPGVVGPSGLPSRRRFNVYRNNVVVGLVSSLKDAFPAVARLVGEEFFQAMARAYVAEELPATPMMFDYGEGFPAFIGRFEPAACLPYLGDVARVERAWVEAYHAAEASPIGSASLAGFRADEQPNVRFALHPSLRLVRSRFPALAIWRMNTGDGVPGLVNLGQGGEDILVLRPEAHVEMRSLPAGGAAFLLALGAGFPVLKATTCALSADSAFDLPIVLAGLVHAGAFVDADCTSTPQVSRP